PRPTPWASCPRGCRGRPPPQPRASADPRHRAWTTSARRPQLPVPEDDQPVLDEPGGDLALVPADLDASFAENRPQQTTSPLAITALKRLLAADRRGVPVPGLGSGAPLAHRTDVAGRPGRADPLPELHQRLAGAPWVPSDVDPPGEAAAQHSAEVDVEREHRLL